jgi:hypothetical protein
MIFQVSQVYQTMKIESLSQMIPFFDFSAVEKISVDAVKHNFIAMKLDHMKHVVLFDTQVCFILYAVFLIVYHQLSLSLSLILPSACPSVEFHF